MIPRRKMFLAAAALFLLAGCHRKVETIRIGVQAELASAPALLGFARDDFQTHMSVPVRPLGFIAGPSVLDALLDDKLDIAYLDVVSAANAYARSKGQFVIVAGVSAGGGALVVSTEIVTLANLRESQIATPQIGSLHDVIARQYFSEKGFMSREQGGEFEITPAANLDLVPLMQKKHIDGAWTTEPWVSALIEEAGGRVLTRDDDLWQKWAKEGDVEMVVVVSKKLLARHPDIVDNFLGAHVALISTVREISPEDRRLCENELAQLAGRTFTDSEMDHAWARVRFSPFLPRMAVVRRAYAAFRLGYLGRDMPDLEPAMVDEPLKAAIKSAGYRR